VRLYCKDSNYQNSGPKGFINFKDFWIKVFNFIYCIFNSKNLFNKRLSTKNHDKCKLKHFIAVNTCRFFYVLWDLTKITFFTLYWFLYGTPDGGPRTETCCVPSRYYILDDSCAELNIFCCLFDYICAAGWIVLNLVENWRCEIWGPAVVLLKNAVFWVVMFCQWASSSWCFEGL
jgi:hypothetical protein